MLPEQDQGLDVLANVISRQKAMAVDIGNELDTQNGELEPCFFEQTFNYFSFFGQHKMTGMLFGPLPLEAKHDSKRVGHTTRSGLWVF